MTTKSTMKKLAAHLLIAGILNVSIALPSAQASMVSTESALSSTQINADKETLQNLLARTDVRGQLQSLGVSPDEVEKRLDSLTAEEMASLHENIQQLPAGGDGLVGAVVFIFVVLLITDILGLTDVFTFVKKSRR